MKWNVAAVVAFYRTNVVLVKGGVIFSNSLSSLSYMWSMSLGSLGQVFIQNMHRFQLITFLAIFWSSDQILQFGMFVSQFLLFSYLLRICLHSIWLMGSIMMMSVIIIMMMMMMMMIIIIIRSDKDKKLEKDEELECLLSTVKQFSDDIGSEFGLNKCAKEHSERVKFAHNCCWIKYRHNDLWIRSGRSLQILGNRRRKWNAT